MRTAQRGNKQAVKPRCPFSRTKVIPLGAMVHVSAQTTGKRVPIPTTESGRTEQHEQLAEPLCFPAFSTREFTPAVIVSRLYTVDFIVPNRPMFGGKQLVCVGTPRHTLRISVTPAVYQRARMGVVRGWRTIRIHAQYLATEKLDICGLESPVGIAGRRV